MARPASSVVTRRYRLDSLVARGACAEVYRATDRETGEVVALKRLLSEHKASSVVGVRFARETKLLSQIDSPHVVRFIASGPDEHESPCLVLEWLEGQDLATRLQRGPLAITPAVRIAHQAALGLAALHESGIVHRDVKPSNFMVLEPPEPGAPAHVKLVDLGIARLPSDPALTVQGTTIGTPAYMSPEQARGEEGVSTRSDIFSLGVVLYEMLAGRRPFDGQHPFVLLAKIVLEEPPRLSAWAANVPEQLERLVACAMCKSEGGRFATALEMAEALASVPASSATAAMPRADVVTQQVVPEHVSAVEEQRVVTALFALFRPGRGQRKAMHTFEELAENSHAATHRTLGGRMIAVFGSERSVGDEPVRAARVALRATSVVPDLRLAISTGRAVAGAAGLSGDAIERGAADLDGVRAAIRVDGTTARMLAAQFVIEQERGEPVLRGERRSIDVSRTLLGKATRCHGREREIGTLAAIFRECVAEPRARAVVLTGPAGGGKSRVRYEFLLELEGRISDESPEERPAILFGRGDPLGAGSAFAMIASALRRAAGILDGEPPALQADKLRTRLAARLGDAAERVALFLGEMISVPVAAESSPTLRAARRDHVLMGDSMRQAWIDWLRAECADHPVVLVLEDMHWGDLPTVKFVDAALRALADSPLLVLALARPEVHERFPDLWAEREPLVLRLGDLSAKAGMKLVRDAIGDELPEDTAKGLVERAQGNPFYLEELIRAVADGKSGDLPDSVLGMVQARLDALGVDARRLLRAASVFGSTFYGGGVQILLGDDSTSSVAACLDDLADREVVTRRAVARFPGETEYAFRHALVRDAAYAMLLDRDRVLAHRLAGVWLERMGESDAIVLAEHFDRGGEPASAVQWYRRGAEQALDGHDLGAVIERAGRGIALCADAEVLGALHLLRANALRWRGEPLQVERAAVEAMGLLSRGGAAWYSALREAIVSTGRLASTAELRRYTDLASEVEPTPGAEVNRVIATAQGVVSLLVNGLYGEAVALLQRVESMPPSVLDPGTLAQKRRAEAFLSYFGGDLGDALAQFAASVEEFERIHDARNACLMRSNLGYLRAEIGDYAGAEETMRLARAAAERMGLQDVVASTAQNLGYVLAYLGRLVEARSLEEFATKIYEEQRDPRLECASRTYMSLIAHLEGDFVTAEREARLAAQRVSTNDAGRLYPLGALARALLAQDRVEEALEAARAATAIASSDDWYIEGEGLARLVLAEALDRAGDRAAAKDAIASAAARLHARAHRLRDPDLRRSFLESVPEHARTLELAGRWGAG